MQSKKDPKKLVLALAGGVGGAKLAHGLSLVKDPCDLVIVVNTGDDFTHLGFHISPDLDSVIYKFAGINDPIRGWGIEMKLGTLWMRFPESGVKHGLALETETSLRT